MAQAHLRIQRLESDVGSDPFDLMGPGPSKKRNDSGKSGKAARDEFKKNITQSLFPDNRYPERKTASATRRRPSNEIFKILEGTASQRQVVPYDDEAVRQAARREEENLSHNKQARIVIHRHSRSSNRARNSSRKAKESVEQMSEAIVQSRETQEEYKSAVQAIDDAAYAQLGGKKATGEGIDAIRREQQAATNAANNPSDFRASRGARAAAQNIQAAGSASF